MTREQVGILNALVTHAVEQLTNNNMPVRDDERQVARMVGSWCLSREGPLIVEPDMRVVVGGRMGHALTEGGNATAGYWTRCTCEWDSGPRPNPHRAYADWLAHAAEQLPTAVRRYVAGRGVSR